MGLDMTSPYSVSRAWRHILGRKRLSLDGVLSPELVKLPYLRAIQCTQELWSNIGTKYGLYSANPITSISIKADGTLKNQDLSLDVSALHVSALRNYMSLDLSLDVSADGKRRGSLDV
ncbi:hypothetical protein L1987_11498 [Smallanthus sonchifolius]|uniref:Uncharacterized protein n=1 Tax=Smallanthus sonchifolius TaxID=185202 RepID=A0ACB9JC23_9ASTR|nr:hypothetical protein L1987_11498 [Smallanthus sonchifolius]